MLGVHSVAWDEAQKSPGKIRIFIAGIFGMLLKRGFPEWELGVQIIPEENEHKFEFDLLDPTKLIPEESFRSANW